VSLIEHPINGGAMPPSSRIDDHAQCVRDGHDAPVRNACPIAAFDATNCRFRASGDRSDVDLPLPLTKAKGSDDAADLRGRHLAIVAPDAWPAVYDKFTRALLVLAAAAARYAAVELC
jgi:hypothetical protein